ncbi:MAG: transcriptional regulator [Treponema sp.]|mgnify:CR=1 FL=1|nr:transcriptional regulator [Treponema sp.]
MEYTERTKRYLEELCTALTIIKTPEHMQDFLECLLTEAEVVDIANRWLLVREIDRGATQREIAKNYSMSLCKITRGSRELKKENSAFKKVLEDFKASQSE